jgi:hypothetical protein
MANNYTEATMIPSVHLTEKQEKLLRCYGASCEPDGPEDKLRYVYWEDHFTEEPDENDMDDAIAEGDLEEGTKMPDIQHFLRDILLNPENQDVEALDVEGCWRCDKLRPGEFGGLGLLVTRKEYAYISTGMLKLQKGKIVPDKVVIRPF